MDEHLSLTDNEIISALRSASFNSHAKGHKHAKRIIDRTHFKLLDQRNPSDTNINSMELIYDAARQEFGNENVRRDDYPPKGEPLDFSVLMRNGEIVSSLSLSKSLKNLPIAMFDYVFIELSLLTQARTWLKNNKQDIIALKQEDA